MEESLEYLTNLCLVFVDFEKGFDSILCLDHFSYGNG
jgi:hypothetical protein